MLATPNAVVSAARCGLVATLAITALLIVQPSESLGITPDAHRVGLALSAYVSMLLGMLALPWSRKGDMFAAWAVFCLAMALIGLATRREGLVLLSIAAFGGAGAAYAPARVEILRRRAREGGGELFEVLEIEERRARDRLRREREAMQRS